MNLISAGHDTERTDFLIGQWWMNKILRYMINGHLVPVGDFVTMMGFLLRAV